MASKVKQRTVLVNPVIDGQDLHASLSVTPSTGAVLIPQFQQLRRARLKLTSFAIAVAAADDFGSLKLCDLPNSQLLVVGAIVDLDATVTGTGSSLAAVDLAIGTVATASTNFANAGEKNVVDKLDCTSGGVIDGAAATAINLLIAAGASNALYVNVATGNISTAGVVTLNGYIDIIYVDLGKAS